MSKITDKLTAYIADHSTADTYPALLSILNDVIDIEREAHEYQAFVIKRDEVVQVLENVAKALQVAGFK